MTHEEHKLMLFMFVKQMALFRALIESLKSKGLLETDDLQAYEALIRSTDAMSKPVFDEVAGYYSGFATSLGIADQLPDKR
jgi:hypothetical protein